MAKVLASFEYDLNGVTTRIDVRPSEAVKVEKLLSSSLPAVLADNSLTSVYRVAHAVLRLRNTEGVPQDFDAFLELGADIMPVDDEGKASSSALAASTG